MCRNSDIRGFHLQADRDFGPGVTADFRAAVRRRNAPRHPHQCLRSNRRRAGQPNGRREPRSDRFEYCVPDRRFQSRMPERLLRRPALQRSSHSRGPNERRPVCLHHVQDNTEQLPIDGHRQQAVQGDLAEAGRIAWEDIGESA